MTGIDVALGTVMGVAAVFFFAGLVKGVVGLGLPSIVVGLGSLVVGVKPAMALLVAPAIATNVWQAVVGGRMVEISRRTWPMMLTIVVGTWFGVALLARLDGRHVLMVLGLTLMGYAAFGLMRPALPHPGAYERVLQWPVGLLHGVVAGLTGSYIPAVIYLQSLGLAKDALVQGMGVIFTMSSLALGAALAGQGLLTRDLGMASVAALVPAFAGMWIGQQMRGLLSEAQFRRLLLSALGLLGLYIVWRAVG